MTPQNATADILLFAGNEESPEDVLAMCLKHNFKLILCEDISKYLPVTPDQLERFSSFSLLDLHQGETDYVVYMKPSALEIRGHGEK